MDKETVYCVPTTDNDLDAIYAMERHPDNAPTIRRWSRQKHIASKTDPNIAHYSIRSESDNRIVGYFILVGLQEPDDSIEFKRIVIAEKGKGFGRAAVRFIKSLAFTKLHAHRLWLEVMDANPHALKLYLTEGFVREGVHREGLRRGDEYASLICMSMLAQEFKPNT